MDIGSDDVCGFECNICLALAEDSVITPCGHLYCWSCLMKWLFKSHSNNECPICRTGVEFSQLIFSYGKSNLQSDPTSGFKCNICSELARDPIVTLCGHLYCWPCLNKWLNKWNSTSNCWVCGCYRGENIGPSLWKRDRIIRCRRSGIMVCTCYYCWHCLKSRSQLFCSTCVCYDQSFVSVWSTYHGSLYDKGVTSYSNSRNVASLFAKGKKE